MKKKFTKAILVLISCMYESFESFKIIRVTMKKSLLVRYIKETEKTIINGKV